MFNTGSSTFIPRVGDSAPWLALGFVILAVSMFVLATGFAMQGQELRAEQIDLEARLVKAKKTAEEITETALPPPSTLFQLRTRVASINQVTGLGGEPLTDVLQKLENSLPDDIVLVSLRYQRRQREIVAVAETNRADNLSDVLQRLERNGLFREVRLVRQSERAGGKGGMQFELRLKD